MELIGNTIKKSFLVKYNKKKYHINYLNSDYPDPCLFNRDNWEIVDEDGEELNIYFLKSNTEKDSSKQKLFRKLYDKLISFCIKNFDNYQPMVNKI